MLAVAAAVAEMVIRLELAARVAVQAVKILTAAHLHLVLLTQAAAVQAVLQVAEQAAQAAQV
jgi:hypothetical protein